MTIIDVRDGICSWFGGSYDQPSRSYRQPTVRNLGAVRRSPPKSASDDDYYVGQTSSGAVMGSTMELHLSDGIESREAIAGAFDGVKLLRTSATLGFHLISRAEFAEDASDAFYQLLEDLKARLRVDRCMGTGGFENGGFVAGEGGQPWVRWRMDPIVTVDEITYGYLAISFDVTYYERG